MKPLLSLATLFALMFSTPALALENIENYYDLPTTQLVLHAEENDPYAQYILAERHLHGQNDAEKNAEYAHELFQKAYQGFEFRARAEDTPSMLFLGLMHELGYGQPENPAKALSFFAKAASQGDAQGYELVKISLKADDQATCNWLAQNASTPAEYCE